MTHDIIATAAGSSRGLTRRGLRYSPFPITWPSLPAANLPLQRLPSEDDVRRAVSAAELSARSVTGFWLRVRRPARECRAFQQSFHRQAVGDNPAQLSKRHAYKQEKVAFCKVVTEIQNIPKKYRQKTGNPVRRIVRGKWN